MRKKPLLISTVALTAVLVASSMIAVSQAWGWGRKPEYIGYDLTQITGPGETTYVDASGAPELIIIDGTETAIEISITIDDQVYTYPENFDYEGKKSY